MTDEEPELTRSEWEAKKAVLRRAQVEVDETVAPICQFRPETHQNERRSFANQMIDFLRSPIGPELPPDVRIVPLLADDLIGAWMPEIETQHSILLVTMTLPDGAESDAEIPVVILLTRSERDVNEVVDGDDLSWCNITPSHQADMIADSALFPCDFFWWSTAEGLIGWQVEVLWPLGYHYADERDLGRVSLHRHNPVSVLRQMLGTPPTR
jgi:hypothetical protein